MRTAQIHHGLIVGSVVCFEYHRTDSCIHVAKYQKRLSDMFFLSIPKLIPLTLLCTEEFILCPSFNFDNTRLRFAAAFTKINIGNHITDTQLVGIIYHILVHAI